ncbi:MAG: SRPBCC family protein [candidate division KSB1 bacterium]|nr:SRPBCC family protein [candidate division KSB1 bacterium]MDZ7366989.1 SRPBCC family protein [candidate division KSB1 bacterium]MDZ7406806.1 SRPBCC family protein [candidate division KSB1 bacterium]
MTVLSIEKILQQPREILWRLASQLGQAPRWIDGLEKVEHLSGPAADIGGVWRVHLRWEASYQIVDLEITEWREGEGFGLRPLSAAAPEGDIELLEIVFNLKAVANRQTQASVQCEYKPLNQFAKLKNLMFLRRHYMQRLAASLEALGRIVTEPTV